jgi:hypothetical protein
VLHKTALATAASIAGVFLAGAVAVGANIGILGSNGDQFGEPSAFAAPVSVPVSAPASASASAPASTAATGAPGVSAASATSPAPSASETVLEVPGIATITVAQTGSGLALVAVQPAAGWTWAEGPADGLDVVLRSSAERVVVTMWLADGQLRQAVERAAIAPTRPAPTMAAPPSPSPAAPTTTTASRSRHDDDDHDDDDRDDDHEVEGADDDD